MHAVQAQTEAERQEILTRIADAQAQSEAQYAEHVLALQEQIANSYLAIEELNKDLPPDAAVRYAPPPFAEIEAKLDALIALLGARGMIDSRMLTIEVLMRWLRNLRESHAGAAEHKKSQRLWRPGT